ncbi:MAG TPA: MotA/TolQ/ExbB proton channel family protein [Terriglobales bacterium]|nr:MotA/TolQ/ExbB proton channel family protein [Terriglobales bacterium]
MDFMSVFGIVIAFASLGIGYAIDGGNVGALWLLSAMIIVAGGSVGSVFVSYGFDHIKRMPKLFISLFKEPKTSMSDTIDFLVKLSENARKDGILSLEKIIDSEEATGHIDPFLKSGIMMVIDGADLEQIKSYLETDIAVTEQKTASEISMFDSMAAFAPAYGMIGTIMGLIQVLANMESPEAMAAAIAVAFITTLYGVVIANAFCSPAANKLRMRLEYSQTIKEMIIEGICGIRNGDNPKILRERLSPYLIYTATTKAGGSEKGKAEKGKAEKREAKSKQRKN